MSKETWNLIIGIILALCTITFSGLRSVAIRKIGDNIHSSVKNFYFGLSSTVILLIANTFIQPEFFQFWKIGTPQYCMSTAEFLVAFTAGFFGWASQESLALALSAVKSGTLAAFQNVAIVMGVLCDVFYFKLNLKWNDYTGAGMIVVFTILQSVFS